MDFPNGPDGKGHIECTIVTMVEPVRERQDALKEPSDVVRKVIAAAAERNVARGKEMLWQAERTRRAQGTLARLQGSGRMRER